jgi:hypothetical protein
MRTAGRELYDEGWRQGSRLKGDACQSYFKELKQSGLATDPLPPGMSLVLATQDCDLVKADDRLPYVEAVGCVEDGLLAATIRPNDARYFVLDPASGVVADRAYGAFLLREALKGLSVPELPFGGDAVRARRFARWLGARYDRPALPEEAVRAIQRPLVDAVRRLCRPGRPHEALNRDLHEIRVAGDLEEGPPFAVLLVFVLTETADVAACQVAIAELIEATGFAVEGASEEGEVFVQLWVAAPPSRLSLATYQGSIGIPLAYESVRGEETVGADPLDAESA